MSTYNAEYLENLKKNFGLVTKKIGNYEKRELPRDEDERQERINQYVSELTVTYNSLVSYLGKFYPGFSIESKNQVREGVNRYKALVIRALSILQLQIEIPENFGLIDKKNITSLNTSDESVQSSTIFLAPESAEAKTRESQDTGTQHTIETMSKAEFLKLAAASIRQNFSGDPLALQPFLASIELLKDMAETDELLATLRKFILTKLEGFASEIIPANVQTVDEITNCLKSKIKPESSKVIEGRMMALRADKNNLQEYSKQAEELADAFRRALVMDGIPLTKAEEMTIDKTVELCRSNAQSNIVKSVLASTKFTNPKEVIAKYITESNTSKQEAQVFALRKFQSRNNNSNQNGSNRGNNHNRRANSQNNRNFGNNANSNRGWRGNQNRNNGNNGRNFNRNDNGNNDRRQNNNFQNNNYQNNNFRNVRRLENASAAQSTLGEANEE